MKIILKIFIVFFSMILFFSAINYLTYELNLNPVAKVEAIRIKDEITKADLLFKNLVAEESNSLIMSLGLLAQKQSFKNFYLKNDRLGLYSDSEFISQLLKDYGIAGIYFLLPNDTVFLNVYEPKKYGMKMECAPLEKAKITNKAETAMEFEQIGSEFTLSAVTPYYNGSQLIGYLEIEKRIDNVLENFKKIEGDDVILLIDKQYIDRDQWAKAMTKKGAKDNWENISDYVIVGTTMKEELSGEHIKSHETTCFSSQLLKNIKDHITILGKFKESASEAAACGGSPLLDAKGKQIGVIVTHHDISKILVVTNEAKKTMFFIILCVGLIMSLIAMFIISKLVLKPIQQLTETIKEISTGNLKIEMDPKLTETQDEMGELALSFERMQISLKLAVRKIGIQKKENGKEKTVTPEKLVKGGLIKKDEMKKK